MQDKGLEEELSEISLEQTFNKDEYIISLLKDVKEKQDLELKAKARILERVASLDEKLDMIQEIVSRRFRTQNDAAVAKRERTWSI